MTHEAKAPFQLVVTVDPLAAPYRFRGWGTSLCWWANALGWVRNELQGDYADAGLPFTTDAVRNALADTLFSPPPTGLGLTVLRYNIGGGDDPTCMRSKATDSVTGGGRRTHFRTGADVPGWQSEPDAAISDALVDFGQLWFLCAAQSRGADTFEAFANSPPWWMTASGCTSGAEGKNGASNLLPSCIDAFANYLVAVLVRIQEAHGIVFQTLDPVNEPSRDSSKCSAGSAQEGCNHDVHTINKIVMAVRQALARTNLPTEISIADEVSPAAQISLWAALTQSARQSIAQINTHTYGTIDRSMVRRIADQSEKRLWMSEICFGGSQGKHDHNSMSAPLQLAESLSLDLRQLRPECWIYWQTIEDEHNGIRNNGNWGLIHADFSLDGRLSLGRTPSGSSVTTFWEHTKQYWALAQFCHFIRPGTYILDVTEDYAKNGVFVVAAFQPISVTPSTKIVGMPPPSYTDSTTHSQASKQISSFDFASVAQIPSLMSTNVPVVTLHSDKSSPLSSYEMISWTDHEHEPDAPTYSVTDKMTHLNLAEKENDTTRGDSRDPGGLIHGSLVVVLTNKNQYDLDVLVDYGKQGLVPQGPLELDVYRTSETEALVKIVHDAKVSVVPLIPLMDRPQPFAVRLTPESITTLVLRRLGMPLAGPWRRSDIPHPLTMKPFRIESVFSKKVMTASLPSANPDTNYASLIQSTYRPGDLTQHWILTETSTSTPSDPIFVIQSLHDTRILDIMRCEHHNGASIITWPRFESINQTWRVEHIPNEASDIMRIVSTMHGKSMDVCGCDMGEGANIIVWDYHGGENQQWKFIPVEYE